MENYYDKLVQLFNARLLIGVWILVIVIIITASIVWWRHFVYFKTSLLNQTRPSIFLLLTIFAIYLTIFFSIYFAGNSHDQFESLTNEIIEKLSRKSTINPEGYKEWIHEQRYEYQSTMLIQLRAVVAGTFGVLVPLIIALYVTILKHIHEWLGRDEVNENIDASTLVGFRGLEIKALRGGFIIAVIFSLASLIGLFIMDETTPQLESNTRLICIETFKTLGYGSQIIFILMLVAFYIVSTPLYRRIYSRV